MGVAAREAHDSGDGSSSNESNDQVANSEASGPASETISTDTPESATAIGEAGNAASLTVGIDLGVPEGERLSISFEEALATFTKDYPKLFALCQAAKDQELIVSQVRIAAPIDGRRRGGIRHAAGVADYPVDAFTPQQLEQLLSDADFTVELI